MRSKNIEDCQLTIKQVYWLLDKQQNNKKTDYKYKMYKHLVHFFILITFLLIVHQSTAIDLSAFNQTQLAGRFTVFYATGVDPRYKIDLDFTGYKLRIIGCNKHNAQFNFTSQTKAFLMGKLNSTSWRCLVEDDDAVVNTLIATRKMYRYGSQIVGEDGKGNVILKGQLIGTMRSLNEPFLGVQRQGGYTVGNVLLFPGSNSNSNTGFSNLNNQNNPSINSLNTINTVGTTSKVPTKTTQPTPLPSFSPYNLITDSITPSSLYGMSSLLKNPSTPTSSVITNTYAGSTSLGNSSSFNTKNTPDTSTATTESKSVINTAFSVNNSLSNSSISDKSNLTTSILTTAAKETVNSSLIVSSTPATSLNSTPVLVNSNTDKLINQTIGVNKLIVTDQNVSNFVTNSGVSSQSVTSSSSLINRLSKQNGSVPVVNISEKGKVSEENKNILVAQSLNSTQPRNRGINITNNSSNFSVSNNTDIGSSISSKSIVSANLTTSLISLNSKQPIVSTVSLSSENISTSSVSSPLSSSVSTNSSNITTSQNSSNQKISQNISIVSSTSKSSFTSSNISTSQLSLASTYSQANQSTTIQKQLPSDQNLSSADLSKKLAQLVTEKKDDLNKTTLSSDVSPNIIKEDASLLRKTIENIAGQYIFILPPLNVDVDNQNFIVNGCNIHAYNIGINENTKQISLVPLTSTSRACVVDFDSYYKNALNKSKYITNTTNGFQIRDQNKNIVLQLSQHQPGNYLMSFPPVEMKITEDSIIFQGCNTNNYEYFLDHRNGDLKVGQSSTTNKFCLFNDFDERISKALTSSTYILSIQKGLAFKLFDEILGIAYLSDQKTKSTKIVEIPELQNLPLLITPNLFEIIASDFKDNQQTPSLPGISVSSIQGTYKLVSDKLQPLFIQFDEEYLQFQSCNINRIPYALYTDDAFFILEGGSSTQRACSLNNDLKYIQLLQKVTRVKKTQNGFILMQDEKQLATLSLRVRNDVVKFNMINGAYSLQVTGLQAIISASQISIKGCNIINIPYRFETLGEIKFSDLIVSSGSCTWDVDSLYSKAILRSKYYKQVAEGYVLSDQKGVETVKFISTLGNQKIKSFSGKFVVKLPSAGIKLRIIDGNFILSGCNQHTFKYSLADDGSVVFGNPSSTRIPCQIDNDNVFLFALLKSQNIAISGNSIVFNNANKQNLIKITNLDSKQDKNTVSSTQTQQIKINQPSPYKLKDGQYSIILFRSSFPKLNLTIDGNKTTLKGCNAITLYYNASSDKKINFENRSIQSQNVCKDDFDSFYVNALNSIRKYEQSKGMYTLFNDKGASTLNIISNSLTGATQASTANYQNAAINNASPAPVSIASVATASIKAASPTNITAPSADLKVQATSVAVESIKKAQIGAINSNNNESKDQTSNNKGQITINTIITSSKVNSINQEATEKKNDTLPLLDISGEYNFQLPYLSLQVIGNSLIFKSCNTHRFPFVANNGNYLFGNAISTKKECKNDVDNYYISMIQNITKSSQVDKKLTFFNKLLQSQFSIQSTPASTITPSTLTSGTYHAYLPSTKINISNNSLRIKACKNESLSYKTDENNKILFSDDQNIGCSSLYHSIIVRQIKQGMKISKIENGFQLLDKDGKNKGVFLLAGAN